eukprot:scaffold19129_cov167-Skeletonema_dohrnii-CCMP3373.AAC.1
MIGCSVSANCYLSTAIFDDIRHASAEKMEGQTARLAFCADAAADAMHQLFHFMPINKSDICPPPWRE